MMAARANLFGTLNAFVRKRGRPCALCICRCRQAAEAALHWAAAAKKAICSCTIHKNIKLHGSSLTASQMLILVLGICFFCIFYFFCFFCRFFLLDWGLYICLTYILQYQIISDISKTFRRRRPRRYRAALPPAASCLMY